MICKLSSLFDILSGGTPKTAIAEYWGGDIPWLSVKDFNNGDRFVSKTEKTITIEGFQHCASEMLKPNDIIISARGTVGALAMISTPMAFNQSCFGLRAKKGVDPSYLYYLLKHSISRLKQITHGSVFDTLTRDSFSSVEVDVCDYKRQLAIAKVLSDIDDKIYVNNQINQNLEAQAESIYDSLIAGADETWSAGTLEDLSSSIVCGKTPSTKDPLNYGTDVPFVTIPDLYGQVFITNTERSLSLKGASSQFNKYLPPFTVVVSCIGTAGLVSILSEKSQTNQQINSIIPKEGISPFYCYFVAKRKKDEINAVGMSGSTIVNLNKQAFSRLETIIPSQLQMADFDRKVRPLFQAILDNQKQNRLLAISRELLLPKLMSGEINVDNIEVR